MIKKIKVFLLSALRILLGKIFKLKSELDVSKIAVVGLPRSGTTIFSNYIFSFSSIIGFSEPFWFSILNNNKKNSNLFIENAILHGIDLNHIEELPKLLKELPSIANKIVCIKETFRKFDIEPYNILTKKVRPDLIIFLIRNPLIIFNSWKRRKDWDSKFQSVELFCSTFLLFTKEILNCKMVFRVIEIDEFIKNPNYEFNRRLNGIMRTNKIGRIIVPNISSYYGDQKANKSFKIKKEIGTFKSLSEQEIARIENECIPSYQLILQKFK